MWQPCFRPFEEIWAREVWQLIRSRAVNMRFAMPYEVCSDRGLWLFKSTDSLNLELDLDATFRKLLNNSLPLNRKGRRALKAQLWQDHRLSERGFELSRPHWSAVVHEIAREFPVNDPHQVVDVFVRRLSGHITDVAMERELAQMLLRPTQMVRFAFEMDELRTQCPQVVVAFGETVVRAVADLRARLAEVSDSVRSNFWKYVPATVVRRPALEAALRGRRHIRGLRISDEQVSEIVHDAALGALPAVDLISRATQVYAAQHANANKPRKARYSDGPDLLHLTYLPYCDVFRADGYTADVLRQCHPLASAKVARSLEDLPALIERHIALAA